MTKQEIEQAIKNGESVWEVINGSEKIVEIKSSDIKEILNDTIFWGKHYYSDINDLFKTKAEAEHYLHHANVSRIEHLPFLTWDEFLSEEGISFVSADGFRCCLYYDKVDDMIYLDKGYETDTYGATEANFYKAYDECVRLFKGGGKNERNKSVCR